MINIWIALRADAQALIKTRLNWDEGEYTGPVTDRQAKLFRLMSDRGVVQKLFRVDSLTQDWTLWSVYFNFTGKMILKKVKDELDQLALDYPNHIKIVGAWHWDGRQVGTDFVIEDVTRDVDINDPNVTPDMIDDPRNDEWNTFPQIIDPAFVWPQITVQQTSSEITGTSGTPTYPTHSRIKQFIPDDVTFDSNGNETSRTRPTVPRDINLLAGQSPRRFT